MEQESNEKPQEFAERNSSRVVENRVFEFFPDWSGIH
jgi:hypothetical protein